MKSAALVAFLIVTGEFFTIIAELGAIRLREQGANPWLAISLMTVVYVLSGCCLLPAYYYAGKLFRSTWTTAALTVGTVLVLEPLTIAVVFSETPSTNSLLGFICGVIGLMFCVFDGFVAHEGSK